MPQAFRESVNCDDGPDRFTRVGTTVVLLVLFFFRRFFVQPTVAWTMLNLTLLFMGLSMTDPNFAAIVTKPDNVPIVALVFLLGFFTWLATYQAVQNDERMKQGRAAAGKAGRREGAGLARPGLHRADLHDRADGVADLSGRSCCKRRWKSRPAA